MGHEHNSGLPLNFLSMYCSILLIELPGFSFVSIFAMVSMSSYPAACKHFTMYSGSFFFISGAGFSLTDSDEL